MTVSDSNSRLQGCLSLNLIIMGLDMYLKKHTYVKNWEHMSANEKTQVVITKNGNPHPNINPERVSYIIEDVMYWRKSNQIHNWFAIFLHYIHAGNHIPQP